MGTKQKEWTPHGEIEYETTECTSCEMDRINDNVHPTFIAKRYVKKNSSSSSLTFYKLYEQDMIRMGHTCDTCIENNVVEPPKRTKYIAKGKAFLAGILFSSIVMYIVALI